MFNVYVKYFSKLKCRYEVQGKEFRPEKNILLHPVSYLIFTIY